MAILLLQSEDSKKQNKKKTKKKQATATPHATKGEDTHTRSKKKKTTLLPPNGLKPARAYTHLNVVKKEKKTKVSNRSVHKIILKRGTDNEDPSFEVLLHQKRRIHVLLPTGRRGGSTKHESIYSFVFMCPLPLLLLLLLMMIVAIKLMVLLWSLSSKVQIVFGVGYVAINLPGHARKTIDLVTVLCGASPVIVRVSVDKTSSSSSSRFRLRSS
jgi:hypothetical protein